MLMINVCFLHYRFINTLTSQSGHSVQRNKHIITTKKCHFSVTLFWWGSPPTWDRAGRKHDDICILVSGFRTSRWLWANLPWTKKELSLVITLEGVTRNQTDRVGIQILIFYCSLKQQKKFQNSEIKNYKAGRVLLQQQRSSHLVSSTFTEHRAL